MPPIHHTIPLKATPTETGRTSIEGWMEERGVNDNLKILIQNFISLILDTRAELEAAEWLSEEVLRKKMENKLVEKLAEKEEIKKKEFLSQIITPSQISRVSSNPTAKLTVVADVLNGEIGGGLGGMYSVWEGSPLGGNVSSTGSSTAERTKRHVRGRKSLQCALGVAFGVTTNLSLALSNVEGAHFFHFSNKGETSYIDSVIQMTSLFGAPAQPFYAAHNFLHPKPYSLVQHWQNQHPHLKLQSSASPVADALGALSRVGVYAHFCPENESAEKNAAEKNAAEIGPNFALLHHALPLGLLYTKAGGSASNGAAHILDARTHTLDDQTQAIFGNTAHIEKFNELIGAPPVARGKQVIGEGAYELVMSNPRGFCEGVNRAVDTVEEALRIWGAPIYVKHEIVHNELVCNKLRAKGAIFIENLQDVPEGSVLIYSSHGIPPEVREEAKKRRLVEVDATCPLVTKVHVYVKKKAAEGYHILLVGHKNHVEVIGTAGEAPSQTTIVESVEDVERLSFGADAKLFYTTQTTLSMDDCEAIVSALEKKYPNIASIPSGSICYATTNRQTALKKLAPDCDLALVVGSNLSSNAKRLVETAKNRGVKAYLVNDADELKESWLRGVRRVALTSSASTPEDAVWRVVEKLKELGQAEVREYVGVEERLPNWRLPRNLETAAKLFDKQQHAQS